MRSPSLRVIAAFVGAPAAAALPFVADVLNNEGPHGPRHLSAVLETVGGAFVVFYIFTLASTLVLGIPALYLFRHVGWTTFTHYGLGGLVIAALTVIIWTQVGTIGWTYDPRELLFLGTGLIGAIAFRALLGRQLAIGRTSVLSTEAA